MIHVFINIAVRQSYPDPNDSAVRGRGSPENPFQSSTYFTEACTDRF